MTKPPACSTCPLVKESTGFCRDLVSPAPKIAVVLRMPSRSDLVDGLPMSGPAGYHFWKNYVWSLGLKKEDLLISNVIRCFPNTGDFPIGKTRVQASAKCAELWDTDLKKFNPNVWGVSISPSMLYVTPNQGKFLRRAFEKAKSYAEQGKRPCLLLGPEARDKFAPWLEGSMKQWQGHFWEQPTTNEKTPITKLILPRRPAPPTISA